MQICGFQKTTLLDYPDHLASIIFLGGCNFRCPFCHNSSLVLSSDKESVIAEGEILAYLKKRQGILEGICISGGEPTLSKNIIPFLERIKELGIKIKLDTNGTNPSLLEDIISRNLLDYVAMDIKSSLPEYANACGIPSLNMTPISDSISILLESRLLYEFRTTVVKELHNEQTFHEIGNWLHGDSSYFLQAFKDTSTVLSMGLHSYSTEEMQHFRRILLPYLPNTRLRGIDGDS